MNDEAVKHSMTEEESSAAVYPELPRRPVAMVPLKVKGFLAFVAVAIYAVLMTTFIYSERAELMLEFVRLQKLHELEDRLRRVDQSAFHVLMTQSLSAENDNLAYRIHRFQLNFSQLLEQHDELVKRFPNASQNIDRIKSLQISLLFEPSDKKLEAVYAELLQFKNSLSRQIDNARAEQRRTSDRYLELWNKSAISLTTFGFLGLITIGVIIGMFFTRLTTDLGVLKLRALDIIHGNNRHSETFKRNDEVGELLQAVNYLAFALEARDKELVIARQRYFYQEKMAAVGALAAGVAHEIGNPIAAMSGVLQEMVDEQQQQGAQADERLETLKAQIRRLSAIIREISGFASPQSAVRDLLDLNGLLSSDSRLMTYDKRMREINLDIVLDPQMPAIYGMADQLTQVIMNLLINAADSFEGVDARAKEIKIRSYGFEKSVRFTVQDNGCGMSQQTIDRIFEAFYTTKKRGTGLGLALCYSIITEHGGTIEVQSELGMGTTMVIDLPIDPRSQARD